MIGVFVAMVGCGSDAAGPGPISAADATAGCQAICEREKTCDPMSTETVAQCTASCVQDFGGGGIREDAFQAVSTCVSNLACSATSESCLFECNLTDAHSTFQRRCIETAIACNGVATACDLNAGGNAAFLCLYTPQVMTELTACYDLACTAIDACFQGVLTKYNLGV